MRPILAVALLMALALASGCGSSPRRAAEPPLTERQRDSVLARSGLPGATTVGRALEVSDDAAARAAALDSLRP